MKTSKLAMDGTVTNPYFNYREGKFENFVELTLAWPNRIPVARTAKATED